jgi:hypothetical protein
MTDNVIALNERHLRRLMRDYVNYHHDDRIHDSLNKDNRIDGPWKISLRRFQQ